MSRAFKSNALTTLAAVVCMAGGNTKAMSVLAYVFFFIPLISGAYKKSDTVKFHTNQGMVLYIANLIYSTVYVLLLFVLIFIPFTPLPGRVAAILLIFLSLLFIPFFVLMVMGIFNALNDRREPLPIIGKIKLIN